MQQRQGVNFVGSVAEVTSDLASAQCRNLSNGTMQGVRDEWFKLERSTTKQVPPPQRALYLPQNSPARLAKAPCMSRKRALYLPQKSPVCLEKEPYASTRTTEPGSIG